MKHGVLGDSNFYGNLVRMEMLVVCVESDKISLLRKLKQLYKNMEFQ